MVENGTHIKAADSGSSKLRCIELFVPRQTTSRWLSGQTEKRNHVIASTQKNKKKQVDNLVFLPTHF
jgi:hypothetical protein